MTDVSAHSDVKMGSERGFGLVFACVFAIIGLWPLVFHGGGIRLWAMGLGLVFLVLAFAAPQALRPLNRAWFRFGLLLGKIVAPIVMGIIFFVTVTPIGLLRRLKNADPLGAKPDPSAKSYWVLRETETAARTSMRKQF